MIEIKKAEDISEQEFESKLEVYALKIDGVPILYCAYKIENGYVEIYDIKGDLSDAMLVDAIIRAVASYAEGRDAFLAKSKNEKIYDLLLPLGFKADEHNIYVTAACEHLLRRKCCGEG